MLIYYANNLSGSFPISIANLVNLTSLDFNTNSLEGQIPSEVATISNLETVNFSSNSFEGYVPDEVRNLSNIQQFNISDNYLRFPHWNSEVQIFLNTFSAGWMETQNNICEIVKDAPVEECNSLLQFYIYTDGNNWNNHESWLASSKIEDWQGVEVSSGHVSKLLLPENDLVGFLPDAFYNLTSLEELDISGNYINGPISSEISNFMILEHLNISNNQFSGMIPTELGDIAELKNLDLSFNHFEGSVPDHFGNLYLLISLRLNDNFLMGNLPESITFLPFLDWVNIDHNSFSIPQESQLVTDFLNVKSPDWAETQIFKCDIVSEIPYEECTVLKDLYYSLDGEHWTQRTNWTQTTDIHSWFGIQVEGGHVVSIQLANNMLYGRLPASISSLSHLNTLVLSNNSVTSKIPATITQLSQLQRLEVDANRLLVPQPEPSVQALLDTLNPGWADTQQGICPYITDVPVTECEALESFYRSLNGGSWEINDGWMSETIINNWSGVSVEGGHVVALDLSWNNLSGEITPLIGNLTLLERLNLSGNHVTGEIPGELGALSRITQLDLAENELSGEVPVELGNLANARIFRLNSNKLQSLPGTIGNLTLLEYLDISENRLRGNLPISLLDLTKLEFLSVANNQLSVPQTNIEIESLLNRFEPDWHLSQDFDCNTVQDIPNSECEALVDLFYHLENEKWLNKSEWLINPSANEWFGVRVQDGHVTELTLPGNGLDGYLTNEISRLTHLARIDVSNNTIRGNIPSDILSLPDLVYLNVENNMLNVPQNDPAVQELLDLLNPGWEENQYYENFCRQTNLMTTQECFALKDFWEAADGESWHHNWEDYYVPALNRTMYKWFDENGDSVWKDLEFKDGHVIAIDFDTAIHGEIPDSFSDLKYLEKITFNNTNLSGNLLSELVAMENLEWVDIRNNRFTGEIPDVFLNLPLLTYVYLDNNYFSGTIGYHQIPYFSYSGNYFEGVDQQRLTCVDISTIPGSECEVLDWFFKNLITTSWRNDEVVDTWFMSGDPNGLGRGKKRRSAYH